MKIVKEQNNPNLNTMGGRIEHARRKKLLSQQELADKVSELLPGNLSIQRQKIGYIEKNTPNRSLSTEELKCIANILDVSTDYLLCRVSSNNVNDINISKETGLNNESITILKEISDKKRSNLLNYLIFNLDVEELSQAFEQYITITHITENLLINPFTNIEKNYKNNKSQLAKKEDILHIQEFLKAIDTIRYDNLKEYNILDSLLGKSQKELDTISKICIYLEDNNGNWDYTTQDNLNFKAYKTIKDILKSYKEYFVCTFIEKNLHNNLIELDKKIINNENIHKDLNLLNNYN